ncbi:MAG TPA: hypothetical protein PKI11_08240 [Candidatus Hydrogenedentes bacterium]|nr:hypothetical protein [Candidatus Hydrogenedentota bacterium]HNT86716.1 hypothetical protein [Candidatus Hydrogenedentota bacterium]
MPKQVAAKRERVIEAVRNNLEGEAAVEFIHQSGYAMTAAGIARHLRGLGGRGRVQDLIEQGKTNHEILALCFPEEAEALPPPPPDQPELFVDELEPGRAVHAPPDAPEFEVTKLTVKLPTELYEAVRLAAKAEGTTQNQIVVDILTSALGQLPRPDHA